jgi:hypothetical protein
MEMAKTANLTRYVKFHGVSATFFYKATTTANQKRKKIYLSYFFFIADTTED